MAEMMNNTEYVRLDVFNARMDRMEALMEKTVMEMKADNERLRSELTAAVSEMKADNAKLRSEMESNNTRLETKMEVINTRLNGMDQRISDLQTVVYWGFAIVGLFVGFAALAPSIADFLRNFRRPSISAEDVQAMIDAAIAKAMTLKRNP